MYSQKLWGLHSGFHLGCRVGVSAMEKWLVSFGEGKMYSYTESYSEGAQIQSGGLERKVL
jgi:hypothetical protein